MMIYVGRSTTLHNLSFCAHTLCMNSITNTFLLVSSLVRSKQLLCFVQGQGQKSEQKHTTKSIDEFHDHSPLLTMVCFSINLLVVQNFQLRHFEKAKKSGFQFVIKCKQLGYSLSTTE